MPVRRPLLAVVAVSIALIGSVTGAAPALAATPTVITGVVTGDGTPLQSVRVSVRVPESTGGIPVVETTTGEDGRYRVAIPASARNVRLQFFAAGATGGSWSGGYADRCWRDGPICTEASPALTLDGTVHRISVALARASALSGRVTDTLGRGVGGLPVGATVSAAGLGRRDGVVLATTNADGYYRFLRLNPYSYVVTFGDADLMATRATPASNGYTAKSATLTLTPGQRGVRDVVLRGGGAIHGVVVDQFGTPLPDATVTWFKAAPVGGFPEATTRSDGRFTLRYLAEGTAQLCVRRGISDLCADGTDDGLTTTVVQFRSTTTGLILVLES